MIYACDRCLKGIGANEDNSPDAALHIKLGNGKIILLCDDCAKDFNNFMVERMKERVRDNESE